MTLEILGIGTAVPEHAIEQADAARQVIAACCDTAEQDRMIEDAIARARANQQASAHASSVR